MNNFDLLNEALREELDIPLVPLGSRGENFIQTYQTRFGVLQFHLVVPGVPKFDAAETAARVRSNENGIKARCLCGSHLLSAKEAANRPQDQLDIEFLRELRQQGKL